MTGGRYRLRVTFVGLPPQTGLPGARLHAATAYPYTASSSLLSAYEAELIDVGGTCR